MPNPHGVALSVSREKLRGVNHGNGQQHQFTRRPSVSGRHGHPFSIDQ